jgi:hypothetical protein
MNSRPVRESLHCPDCHALVDVSRPAEVAVNIRHEGVEDSPTTVILLGSVPIHRCVQFADGIWR